MAYDNALTVFSPDGHLFQVEYALEATNRGNSAVAIRGSDHVIIATEKKTIPKLQDPRTIRKIYFLDQHVFLTFAGLNADARILIEKARTESQNHRLAMEDPVSIEHITRYIANLQQRYTQKGGARPFGVSTLIVGFDTDGSPQLYLTEPSGTYSSWKANSVGKNSKVIREFLEKNYQETKSLRDNIKMSIQSLLEIVQTGSKNMDVVYMTSNHDFKIVSSEDIEKFVEEIERDKDAESERKKGML